MQFSEKAAQDPDSSCKTFLDFNNRVPEGIDFSRMELIRQFWRE